MQESSNGYHVDLKWKGHKLLLKRKRFAELIEHPIHNEMFYIKWSNGDSSKDFYNLSRAKNHARNSAIDHSIRNKHVTNGT